MITRRSVALLMLAGAAAFAAEQPGKSPLDKFIHAPDPAYKYTLAKTIPGEGYTTYVLDLTSQTWPPASVDVTDHPVWKHWLTIIKPDKVEGNTGFLFITGGSIKDPAPTRPDPANVDSAMTTHTVVAEL